MENNNSGCMSEVTHKHCGCLGYGYVPVQELKCLYDCNYAIKNGTIFPELDLNICKYGKVCKWCGGVDND